MPFKNLRKSREYARVYMRKLRATKKGLTSKTSELNPVKPINVKPQVKPEPCPNCHELETIKKAYTDLQQQIVNQREAQKAY